MSNKNQNPALRQGSQNYLPFNTQQSQPDRLHEIMEHGTRITTTIQRTIIRSSPALKSSAKFRQAYLLLLLTSFARITLRLDS